MTHEPKTLLMMLEKAEARVRELGSKYDEWTRLYAEQAARLRAVIEAGEEMRRIIDITSSDVKDWASDDEINAAIARWDAACSGDLPPHPDTERLDWLAKQGRGWNWQARPGSDAHTFFLSRNTTGGHKDIRAAIDAARSQEGGAK